MRSSLLRRHALAAWAVFLALAAVVSTVHALRAPVPLASQMLLPTPGGAHHRLSPPPPLDAAEDDAEFDDEMIMFGELPRRSRR